MTERSTVEHETSSSKHPDREPDRGSDRERSRREDEERHRREDEQRRTDAQRHEVDRRRADELRTRDQERRAGRAAEAPSGEGAAGGGQGPTPADLRLPTGFVDPLGLLLEQAGEHDDGVNRSRDKIENATAESADRLDLVWRRVTDFVFGPNGVSPETADLLRPELDEDLEGQLKQWQKLCASDPFDIVGIADGAEAIGRTIRRYRDRLERRVRGGPDLMVTEALELGVRAVAREVATQLAVAAEPVAVLTDELSRLGRRDQSLELHGAEIDAGVRDEAARRADALTPAEYWSRSKDGLLTPPAKKRGEDFIEAAERERIEEEVAAVASVLDQGLGAALKDWQRELERKPRDGAGLFEASVRAASILEEYDHRLRQVSTGLGHRSTHLRARIERLAGRMATELARVSGQAMPRLIADLDSTAAVGASRPHDQRLEQLSKRLDLDRFWREAKQSGRRAIQNADVAKSADAAFDQGFSEQLATWMKEAFREPLDNRSLHAATVQVRDTVAEYRGRLAQLNDPGTTLLDDALRLVPLRMSEHLRRLAAGGAFLTEG